MDRGLPLPLNLDAPTVAADSAETIEASADEQEQFYSETDEGHTIVATTTVEALSTDDDKTEEYIILSIPQQADGPSIMFQY